MADDVKQQLNQAKAERDLAATKLEALQLEQTYRAVDESHNRRKRRAPTIEFKGEDDQLQDHGRLQAIAKQRDNRRNYGGCKALETQLWLNVIGTCPKVIAHLESEEHGREWSKWFNGWFAKNCDGRNNRHLGDQARMTLASVIREGDILAFFDMEGTIPGAAGTIWYWEADQMALIEKKGFNARYGEIRSILGVENDRLKLKQHYGIITDQYGRTLGYVVSADYGKRGKTRIKYDDCVIMPAENCTLLYNPWRMNQKRGISDAIETANQWQDLERFTESMIQRSIVQSFIAFKITKESAVTEGRDRVDESDNPGGAPDVTSDETDTRYRNYEKLSNNAIEYLEQGDDVQPMQMAGDLPDAEKLISFMQGTGGWSQGLSNMYATGKADASYSASMAESNLTWSMFEWWQKWSERYFFDWVARRAFKWGVKTNRITQGQYASGFDDFSWHGWPKRKAINPMQEASARETDLKTGAINYEDLHGPYWKEKLEKLGEQIQFSRDKGLWVPMWAQRNGS